jgi:hypothetical protein
MQPMSSTPQNETDPTEPKGDKTRTGEINLPEPPQAPKPEPKKT